MSLSIKRSEFVQGCGAAYILMENEKKITQHFCSSDGYAHFDLFSHKETKEVIGDMTIEEFRKIEICG